MVLALADWFEVAIISRRIERDRKRLGPRELVGALRARGAEHRMRGPAARARLKQIIRVVDRLFSSGPNCYRRALIEMAMDPDAATETLHMGLSAKGSLVEGHAWLDSSPDKGGGYQAELSV